jgi:hypothetical protein
MKKGDIICWWSGGVTSAVACKIAMDLYGKERCRFIFIDTHNEDDDTYRFKKDCEEFLYQKEIETLSLIPKRYGSIQDVWYEWDSLNAAAGAVCSSELKRNVRVAFQRKNEYAHQVFGFDESEQKRARNIKKNYAVARPIFPLLMYGYSKEECIKILDHHGVIIPRVYSYGFRNNNCFKTGCVQGGIGYWKKIQSDFPEKFETMAQVEHNLTDSKGVPVTILKDQSKFAKKAKMERVFLKKHKDYPDHKTIDDMVGKDVEPLMECNGFCGTGDKLFNNDK